MTEDERAIRELVDRWLVASKAGDLPAVLGLMADDAIFMVPGQKPFGKEAFAAASKGQAKFRMEGTSRIEELEVLGGWAYLRNHLTVTMTPNDGGQPVRRSGYTLTILRKERAGNWVLVRDANLMTAE
jgi:uncharacterized protein (TIGR02246 family)